MNRAALRVVALFTAPLIQGIIAYSAHFAADRAFNERMRQDRTELRDKLLSHGASTQQVDDAMAYGADVSHNVSSYVTSSHSTTITNLMVMGITFAGLLAFKRKEE